MSAENFKYMNVKIGKQEIAQLLKIKFVSWKLPNYVILQKKQIKYVEIKQIILVIKVMKALFNIANKLILTNVFWSETIIVNLIFTILVWKLSTIQFVISHKTMYVLT